MPRPELHEVTERLLTYLPPYYADELSLAVLDALGREIGAFLDHAEGIRRALLAQYTSEAYGGLAIHEQQLGLAVKPEAEVARRQRIVAAAMTFRPGNPGGWARAMDAACGSGQWTAEPNTPAPNELRVHIPFEEGTPDQAVTEALIRRMTSAHIKLNFIYGEAFIVGISQVGIDHI